MTSTAATTGTTRFRLARITWTVSPAGTGIGAIVPENRGDWDLEPFMSVSSGTIAHGQAYTRAQKA